jgi:hypothetical protein
VRGLRHIADTGQHGGGPDLVLKTAGGGEHVSEGGDCGGVDPSRVTGGQRHPFPVLRVGGDRCGSREGVGNFPCGQQGSSRVESVVQCLGHRLGGPSATVLDVVDVSAGNVRSGGNLGQ